MVGEPAPRRHRRGAIGVTIDDARDLDARNRAEGGHVAEWRDAARADDGDAQDRLIGQGGLEFYPAGTGAPDHAWYGSRRGRRQVMRERGRRRASRRCCPAPAFARTLAVR